MTWKEHTHSRQHAWTGSMSQHQKNPLWMVSMFLVTKNCLLDESVSSITEQEWVTLLLFLMIVSV